MKKDGYYSCGDFAKMAHITKKTLRYYDAHNILKPSFVTPYGARFYTDDDFSHLQQILLLKFLGFSLADIREMTINDSDDRFLADSMQLQLNLVKDQIERLNVVADSIDDALSQIQSGHKVDWSSMLTLIHLTGMENSIKTQYQNASNISARIDLHSRYSVNKQGWFPWIFEQCHLTNSMKVLEIGCGDGTLWTQNLKHLPSDISVYLSDISDGMLRDARRNIGATDKRFHFQPFDCSQIPFSDERFDLVLANHVLFYCDDIAKVCKEVFRVLKPGGIFICSTYGQNHMKEISSLVSAFDDRIVLSSNKLYERFGKENGADILSSDFSDISWIEYEDELHVTSEKPLISYILSCHGNQKQFLLDHYKEFENHLKKVCKNGFSITKEAGIFLCQK